MNILLWIALAGVIVFLSMLYISRRDQQAAQAKTLPAPSPETKADSQQRSATQKSPVAPQDKANTKTPTSKAEDTAKPDDKTTKAQASAAVKPALNNADQSVADAAPKTTAMTTPPAAEPVGPDFGTPKSTAPAPRKSAEKQVAKASASVTEAVEPPSAVPVILKAARRGKPDNLTLISGIGKALQEKLFKSGIFHFDQLATLTEPQTDWVNQQIGFAGRVEREGWIAQAQKLGAQAAAPASEKAKAATKTADKSAVKSPAKNKDKPKAATATKAKAAAKKKPAVKA